MGQYITAGRLSVDELLEMEEDQLANSFGGSIAPVQKVLSPQKKKKQYQKKEKTEKWKKHSEE